MLETKIRKLLFHHSCSVAVGLVGLALSYALSVTALLSGVITSFTETEKQMVSVERAKQYIDGVPKERGVSTPVVRWLSLFTSSYVVLMLITVFLCTYV